MKNLICALLAPLLPAFCLAANNIKMVTYFPVPYASYSNLGVAGTCDVGLLNTCSLDSGPSLKVFKKGDAHALNSGAITVNSGTLSLDSSATEGKVSGSGLTAGTSMGASGSGSLEFKHNLTVKSMPSTIQSAEATNEAIMNSLTLFGKTFPGCDAANNKISWRNLTLNGENGVYLVCGEGEESCTPEYGSWVSIGTSAAADTCDGNSSAEFTCGGTAKECVDVKTVTIYSYAFNAGSPTAIFTNEYQSLTDTCDGNKNLQASSCNRAGGCTDLYAETKAANVNCNCGSSSGGGSTLVGGGGTGGLQGGGNLQFINCMTCPVSATAANYCDGSPRVPCCLNGAVLACPTVTYYKRTGTCTRVPRVSYQKRTVKCCGGAGGGPTEPEPTCADASYKLAHKSECCPSAGKTDTDCWKYAWVSGSIYRGQCYTTQPEPPYCDPGVCNASRLGTFTCYQDYCNGVDEQLYKECSLVRNGW